MDYQAIIQKYYPEDNELRHILLVHSRSVADKALAIADRHPELSLDKQFLEEAAMLHDIGIIRCNAPGIQCFGNEPYICHGRIGAEMLRVEGFPRHARVCERHTGAGITRSQIIAHQKRWKRKLSVMLISSSQRLILIKKRLLNKLLRVFQSLEKRELNVFESGLICSKIAFERHSQSFHVGKTAIVLSLPYAYSADLIYA